VPRADEGCAWPNWLKQLPPLLAVAHQLDRAMAPGSRLRDRPDVGALLWTKLGTTRDATQRLDIMADNPSACW